jgi:hypothetical protein
MSRGAAVGRMKARKPARRKTNFANGFKPVVMIWCRDMKISLPFFRKI